MKYKKAIDQYLGQIQNRLTLDDLTFATIETTPEQFSKMSGCKVADVPHVIHAMTDEGLVVDSIVSKIFVWIAISKAIATLYINDDRKLYR